MKRTRIGGRRGAELSRKDFLRLGGAGLAGAALLGAAGCGGGGGSSSGEVVFSWGPDATNVLPKLIEKFNQQNKGNFQVRYREMPSDTGAYFDQLRTEFQAGGGDTDVIGGDVIWPAQFAANGWISDLSDRFTDADQFLSGPMQGMTYDGKVWGVPWYTDAGLLYYRQDLLEEAGFSEPPQTWEELEEMALKTAQDTGTKDGFVFQGAEYEGGVCNGLEYIWTHGGNVLDPEDPSKVIVDSPESAAGLQTWHDMIADGVSPQAVLQYKEDESHAAFLRSESVFLRNWPYVYALVGNPEETELEPEQVGVTQIPVAQGNRSFSTLGGWNFLINAASDVQDEAWEFIKWMTAPEQLKTNALEGSRLPPREALYEDEEILEKVPVARLGKEAIIENSTPRPVSPYYSDMSLELAKQYNAALAGDVSPEQAVNTLQSQLQQIVEEGQQVS
jgi:multiple sugar transport system substrate-binding protein